MKSYHVTGLMSGTSLDGLDMAFCLFTENDGIWNYEIQVAETFPYPDAWKEKMRSLETGSALELSLADAETGHFFGRIVKEFHGKHDLKPDFIASHGQTIFHRPEKKLTVQIGKGSAIAAETRTPVVCDFRTTDVALGGQGAPLVPIGDQLLFGAYDYCLNLGGFGNISFIKNNKRIAFDTCPVNIVLNVLAERAGKPYDEDGKLASKGKILTELLQRLNSLAFYTQPPPKSLGKEWVTENIFPLLIDSQPPEDLIRTFTEHIALQISGCTDFFRDQKMIVTGGGAFNTCLTDLLQQKCKARIVIPDKNTINFKEALIFAFLGVLRWRGEVNCLKSVTGAERDTIGGAVYL
ncbi:MAG: anhydro-N-acetylmuramic acid kinase [Syntrophothermus sp.]